MVSNSILEPHRSCPAKEPELCSKGHVIRACVRKCLRRLLRLLTRAVFFLRGTKFLTQTLRWTIFAPGHSASLREAFFTCGCDAVVSKPSATEARRSPREETSWLQAPLIPERPGRSDWHLEKALFSKRCASRREGQYCSRVSETVLETSRCRSVLSCENDLCLGARGNYWKKQLWLTRSLRGAYANFVF